MTSWGQAARDILLVGTGGFLGSVCRYLASAGVQASVRIGPFPVGTAAVNIAGCFAIGFLARIAHERQLFSPEMRLLLFVGFLGGFTTFSSFAYESLTLLRESRPALFLANAAGQLILGLACVAAGLACGRIVR